MRNDRQQQQQHGRCDACSKGVYCWQHVAGRGTRKNSSSNSNSSSTSSGCDSNTSSKENFYVEQHYKKQPQQNQQKQQQQANAHHSITPQQLQQLRYYQQMQQQQLQLLQQQLLQRRRLQQQLREQGVVVGGVTGFNNNNNNINNNNYNKNSNKNVYNKTKATLTCNQQYLLQLRLQQQQQQQQQQGMLDSLENDNDFLNNNNNQNNNNNNYYIDYEYFNNNNNNNNTLDYGFVKGQKSRRGMTEFSTNNDISNKSHLSQPLQNSPNHNFHYKHPHCPTNPLQQQQNSQQTQSPQQQQHYANLNNHLNSHASNIKQQQQQNKSNQQHTLPFNSSANNASNISNITSTTTTSPLSSAQHSPLHYRNPLNSPNNSPFAYAYYGGEQQQHATRNPATAAITAQQHQLQQHLRSSSKLPLLTQTQYQQHLNDLLLQQQHLQQQQQQLLNAKDADDELSEESLKQNVAIVLNNLDRYNNALRSIILNEQVSSNSSIFYDDSLLVESGSFNNNYNQNAYNSVNNNHNNNVNNYISCNNSNSNSNSRMATAATPESDYNSNATTPGARCNMLPPALDSNAPQQQQQHVVGYATVTGGAAGAGAGAGVGSNMLGGGGGFYSLGNNLNCSLASSHDFTHDNSDYQWFLDYGYRDGCGGLQRSVLSSLSTSYNCIGDLIYYEDLAKNLDANLAEVDMESFRAEDIHSLLSQLPSYCKSLGGGNGLNGRLQPSLLLQSPLLPTGMAHNGSVHNNMSQTSTTSTNELIDNSICKSELLFSPVKESHISVDSLDLDAYPDDGDIILTCKANKDNYTIAFEGSVLYSDESFYEPNEIALKNKQNFINLHSNLEDIVKRKALEVSMSRSEQAFSAPNKLQKSNTTQLQRYPSGNNNTTEIPLTIRHAPHCTVRKSNSLPNLGETLAAAAAYHEQQQRLQLQQQQQQQQQLLHVSQAVSTSTMDCCRSRNLLPMCQLPISCSNSMSTSSNMPMDQQQQQLQLQQQQRHKHHCCCSSSNNSANNSSANSATTTTNTITLQQQQQQQQQKHICDSGSSGNSSNPPAYSLVKRFIKQKSSNCSFEEQQVSQGQVQVQGQSSGHTCMDVSSGCWPSSEAAGSSSTSSSSLEQRLRKKSMNDSGKGSALSRHEEEEQQEIAFHVEQVKPLQLLRPRGDEAHNSSSSSSGNSGSGGGGGGSLTATNSPAHRRRSIPLRHPQLSQLQHDEAAAIGGSGGGSLLSSEGTSRSNSEQLTQVYAIDRNRSVSGATPTTTSVTSHTSSEMITRSMQTSCGGSLSTRSSLSERFRCVPPSFLAKLNNLGEERQAPIYVIYPNYALPDLGFMQTATSTSADVIFSPFNYKMAVGAASGTGSTLKKRFSSAGQEDEILRAMDYKHVVDWQSLATLLPTEYRHRLKHIPEVGGFLRDLDRDLSQRPLFCMTPPIRRNRPHICDCAQYFQQQQQQTQLPEEAATSSSGSGSSQQPSSGYRGSSTLLTDSELTTGEGGANTTDPLKQMYVYQYEQQRMDSGLELSPAGKAPQPMPRGILRKSASQARHKRNSMIEPQQTQLSKLEKRRSLQEPYHCGVSGSSAEELCDVFEEEYVQPVVAPRKERLSRKEMDARTRAENFLSSLPRSELKHYAEIAAILESGSTEHLQVQYDAAALKKEVSRALSQQKKVSFNDADNAQLLQQQQQQLNMHPELRQQRFSTPPNSPNHSMAAGSGLRMVSAPHTVPRRCSQAELHAKKAAAAALDEKEKRKIESNRFKRLQIQWELMSKDSSMLKDLASVEHTKSGGSTPTSAAAAAAAAAAHKSRIPRPVSYPAGKISTQDTSGGKGTRSPSRIVPPKRYSMTSSPGAMATVTSPSTATTPTGGIGSAHARTPTSRAAVTAPNTPKRRVQSPRTIPRVR